MDLQPIRMKMYTCAKYIGRRDRIYPLICIQVTHIMSMRAEKAEPIEMNFCLYESQFDLMNNFSDKLNKLRIILCTELSVNKSIKESINNNV